jgi:hypothetical protein
MGRDGKGKRMQFLGICKITVTHRHWDLYWDRLYFFGGGIIEQSPFFFLTSLVPL